MKFSGNSADIDAPSIFADRQYSKHIMSKLCVEALT